MRVNIYCCLLALILSCYNTAEIIHEVVQEKQQVTLHCPHTVEGHVKWSRKSKGGTVDILTAGGDRDIKHISDPGKRYGAQSTSLFILKANVSDTGKYLCNNTPATELTVITSGTDKHSVTEGASVRLHCPPDVGGSQDPTWSREIKGEQVMLHVSPAGKMLTITAVQPGDSGLYYCGGKPAVYLNVTKRERSEKGNKPSPTTTTPKPAPRQTALTAARPEAATIPSTSPANTTKRSKDRRKKDKKKTGQLDHGLVLGITVPVTVVILLLLIIITYLIRRRRLKRQGNEPNHIYDEIQNELVPQTATGALRPAGGTVYYLATSPGTWSLGHTDKLNCPPCGAV
uniref:uncharacterized protein LOC109952470 n=1 Tax=Monopterus albus TaxID=43700 RepID=UPI0009B38378|nr:uncharacterized protein LOC109952470 [Monopterus albus]